MIGDRLDTDVEGGRAAGLATLLVLTGVSDAAELLAAPPERRPDYVGADLGALTARRRAAPRARDPGWRVVRRTLRSGRVRGPAGRAARAVRRALGRRWRAGRVARRRRRCRTGAA